MNQSIPEAGTAGLPIDAQAALASKVSPGIVRLAQRSPAYAIGRSINVFEDGEWAGEGFTLRGSPVVFGGVVLTRENTVSPEALTRALLASGVKAAADLDPLPGVQKPWA